MVGVSVVPFSWQLPVPKTTSSLNWSIIFEVKEIPDEPFAGIDLTKVGAAIAIAWMTIEQASSKKVFFMIAI